MTEADVAALAAHLVKSGAIAPGMVRYWGYRGGPDGAPPTTLLRLTYDDELSPSYAVLHRHNAKTAGWTPDDVDLGDRVRFLGANDWDDLPGDEAERIARSWGAEP